MILLVFLAVLPALALILYSSLEHRRAAMAEAKKNVLDLVMHASVYQEQVVEGMRHMLLSLAELPAVRQQNSAACNAIFAKILEKQKILGNIAAADRQGKVYASARPLPDYKRTSAGQSYFERVLQTKEFSIGIFAISRATGKPSLHFAYPILEKGEVMGVVSASVILDYLSAMLAKTQMPAGSILGVIDREGTILVRQPQGEQWVGKRMPEAEIVKTVLAKEEGVTEAADFEGIPCLFAFTPLGARTQDLFVYAGVPMKTVFAHANRVMTRNLISLGVTAALALVMALILGQAFIMKRTNALVHTAQELAAGNFEVRSGLAHETGELGQLAGAFDAMAAGLELHQARLKESEAKYRTLVEQMPAITYIIALDEARTIIYVSPQVETLLGVSSADYQAHPDIWKNQIHPDDVENALGVLDQVQATGNPRASEFRMFSASGALFFFLAETMLVRDPEGRPLYLQGVMMDITEQKQIEKKLQRAYEYLENIFANSADGIGIVDAQGNFQKWNKAAEEIYGFTINELLGKPAADLYADQSERQRLLLRLHLDGYVRNYEVHMKRKDGMIIPCSLSIRLLRNAADQIVGSVTVARDLTQTKKNMAEMQLINEKLQALVRESDQHNREVTLINNMAESLQSCQSIEEAYPIIGKFMRKLFAAKAMGLFILDPTSKLLEAVAAWGDTLTGEQVFTIQDCWGLRQGRVHSCGKHDEELPCHHLPVPQTGFYACLPLIAHGEVLGLLHFQAPAGAAATITTQLQRLAVPVADHISLSLSNIRLRETLRHQVMHDPLTGLFNRRYLEETLVREIHRSQRKGTPLGVIMLDLDHFKRYNDTLGHEAGDRLLEALGKFLQAHVRQEDVSCRYGGEEFIMIMPEAPLEVVRARAEEIRDKVSKLQVLHQSHLLEGTTVSIGVAMFPNNGSKGEELLRAADDALYQAKAAGRNRVVVAAASQSAARQEKPLPAVSPLHQNRA